MVKDLKEYLEEEIMDLMESEMEYWKIPGATLSISKKGMSSFNITVGEKNEAGMEVDENTVFCIASCTKAMTAAMIARLVTEEILDFDKPIVEYLEDFSLSDNVATSNVTLRDILCHRSGLGGHDGIWPDSISSDEFISRLKYLSPSAEFRSKAQYSNIMYTLAGYIVEKVTGMPYNELMAKYIFNPLGMMDTSCQSKVLIESENHSMPFQYIDGKCMELDIWDVDTVAPAASVNTNAKDMEKWLLFLVTKGTSSNGEILISEENFEEMIKKQIDFDDFLPSSEFYPSDGYGFGWQTGMYKGHRICKHTGKIEGYSSLQVLLPDDDFALAIMMNLHSPSIAFFHTILYTVLDKLFGSDYEDWASKFHGEEPPAEEEYNDCYINLFKHRYPDSKRTNQNNNFKKFVGRYTNSGYGHICVNYDGSELFAEYHGQRLTVISYYGNLFCIKGLKEDILTYDLPLSFIEKNDEVYALTIPLEPMVADIVFWKEK